MPASMFAANHSQKPLHHKVIIMLFNNLSLSLGICETAYIQLVTS
jgi:hypothetical protein